MGLVRGASGAVMARWPQRGRAPPPTLPGEALHCERREQRGLSVNRGLFQGESFCVGVGLLREAESDHRLSRAYQRVGVRDAAGQRNLRERGARPRRSQDPAVQAPVRCSRASTLRAGSRDAAAGFDAGDGDLVAASGEISSTPRSRRFAPGAPPHGSRGRTRGSSPRPAWYAPCDGARTWRRGTSAPRPRAAAGHLTRGDAP
jgi:hypothetical protein